MFNLLAVEKTKTFICHHSPANFWLTDCFKFQLIHCWFSTVNGDTFFLLFKIQTILYKYEDLPGVKIIQLKLSYLLKYYRRWSYYVVECAYVAFQYSITKMFFKNEFKCIY